MLAPKRLAHKRARFKKIVFIFLLLLIVGGGIIFILHRFNVLQRYIGVTIISPIPSYMNQKGGVLGIFSKNPKDEIKSTLSSAHIPFEEIYTASQSSYIVKQKDGQEIYLTSQKDIQIQVATLQLILSRLTIEGKNFSRLDLRFDKPVISVK